jgi:hypothetical protein
MISLSQQSPPTTFLLCFFFSILFSVQEATGHFCSRSSFLDAVFLFLHGHGTVAFRRCLGNEVLNQPTFTSPHMADQEAEKQPQLLLRRTCFFSFFQEICFCPLAFSSIRESIFSVEYRQSSLVVRPG